jgi:predicted signal transduction protein with EAL and GGDEF domain
VFIKRVERFLKYIGKNALVPLYNYEIPILSDEKVSLDKGTGVVMCATFGDTTDAEWFEKHKLPYRKVIESNGEIGHYEVSFTQLANSCHKSIGWLLQAYNITERKATEETIRYLALHDPLTGQPNRNYFHELCAQEIDRARIRGGSLAVAYLDLDDFKLINDSYGHNSGLSSFAK